MVLIFYDELPQPNEKEREGGRARKRKSKRLKEKIQEDFFASTPSGRSVCWWSTVRFSGSISPLLHPRSSLKPNELPAEEFLHAARVSVL